MNIIGAIGVFAAMILLILLVYKGMSNIYVAPICAMLVIFTNGLPALDTFLGNYLGGIANWMTVGFAFAILGALFGNVYDKTGAAEAIGQSLLNRLSPGNTASPSKTVLMGLLVVNIVALLLTWTGVSGIVVILTLIPIAFSIARMANIPRKFIPALLMCSGASAAMAAPGSPSIGNLTAASILETRATSALIPGLIASAFVFFVGIWYTHREIMKSLNKGETFDELPGTTPQSEETGERKRPNFILALIPLATVFVTYAVFNLNINVCLTSGIVLAVLLFSRYIQNFSSKTVYKMLNDGIANGCLVFFQVSSLMGFAAVVQQTEVFQKIMASVTQIHGNPLIVATFSVVVFVLFTASPPASLALGLPSFIPAIQAGSLSAAALHRTAVIATTTFESMPYCGAAMISMSTAGVSFKEGYKIPFMCTVIIPLIGTAIATAILMLFPGLA